MTREHRSHVCVGFAMDVTHGFVLDFEVISNFCQECVKKKSRSTPEEFTAWKATHQQHCMQNFEGKSGAMEVEAALRLWQRLETLGYRYTGFISDGDPASFNAVSALNDGAGPYRTAKVSKMVCQTRLQADGDPPSPAEEGPPCSDSDEDFWQDRHEEHPWRKIWPH